MLRTCKPSGSMQASYPPQQSRASPRACSSLKSRTTRQQCCACEHETYTCNCVSELIAPAFCRSGSAWLIPIVVCLQAAQDQGSMFHRSKIVSATQNPRHWALAPGWLSQYCTLQPGTARHFAQNHVQRLWMTNILQPRNHRNSADPGYLNPEIIRRKKVVN